MKRCRPLGNRGVVLMYFAELKEEASRLPRCISESETGSQAPPARWFTCRLGKGGRMVGHPLHSDHGEAAPGDGRGWYGRVVQAGRAPQGEPGPLSDVRGNRGFAMERRNVG